MKNFNDEINCSQPVLVDFYAKWCGPCKMMHPVLDEIEKQMKNQVKIIKIDVDAHPKLALEWRIQYSKMATSSGDAPAHTKPKT